MKTGRSINNVDESVPVKGDHSCRSNPKLSDNHRLLKGFSSIVAAIPVLGLTPGALAHLDPQAIDSPATERKIYSSGEQIRGLIARTVRKKDYKGLYKRHAQKGPDLVTQFLGGGDDCPGTSVPPGQYSAASPFTDSGDTTEANNTIGSFGYPYWDYQDAGGPDEIYSFVIQSFRYDARIDVSSHSPSYRPLVYLVPGCPSGTGNWAESYWGYRHPHAGGTASFTGHFFTNARYYLFVDSATNSAGPYSIRIENMTIIANPRRRYDFDGDGRADQVVYRPTEGKWYLRQSQGGVRSISWGLADDRIVPGDYDGDGRTDAAIWRSAEGRWFVINSADLTLRVVQWGMPGDVPLTGNFDGDSAGDFAIFRPSENRWYVLHSDGTIGQQLFGEDGAKPLAMDRNGDGKADLATYKDGQWRIMTIWWNLEIYNWGIPGDIPVPADYDGDSKTDLAVWRPSNGRWYVLKSGSQNAWDIQEWGVAGDIPVPADYDGDGDDDRAIYRNGSWYLLLHNNSTTSLVMNWGEPGDKPIPAALIQQ